MTSIQPLPQSRTPTYNHIVVDKLQDGSVQLQWKMQEGLKFNNDCCVEEVLFPAVWMAFYDTYENALNAPPLEGSVSNGIAFECQFNAGITWTSITNSSDTFTGIIPTTWDGSGECQTLQNLCSLRATRSEFKYFRFHLFEGPFSSTSCNNTMPECQCGDNYYWTLHCNYCRSDVVLFDDWCTINSGDPTDQTPTTTTSTTTSVPATTTTTPPLFGCSTAPEGNCCDIPCKTFALNKIKNDCPTDKSLTWVSDLGYDKLYFKFDENHLHITSKNNISCFNQTILYYKSKIKNGSLVNIIQDCLAATTTSTTTPPPDASCFLRPSGCQNMQTGLESTGVAFLSGMNSGAIMQGRFFAIGPDDINNPTGTWVFYGENQSGRFIDNEIVCLSLPINYLTVLENYTGIQDGACYLAKKITLSSIGQPQNMCGLPSVFSNSDYLALYCM